MPRTSKKPDDLAAITARREALRAELAELEQQARAVEEAVRDAGRTMLLAAFERVKIGKMEKAEARTIAAVISKHGGSAVAAHLVSLSPD